MKYVEACLRSLTDQTYGNFDIIVVDNGSSDGTPNFISEHFSEVKLIRNDGNRGYAAGCNQAMGTTNAPYAAVLNVDTIAERSWLEELVKAFRKEKWVAAATPKILLSDGRINTCANHTVYTGLTFCRGYGHARNEYENYEETNAISGCSFLVKTDVWKELGGFDEDFFFYLEDVDFSWNAWIHGYTLAYVPEAVVYHDYGDSLPPWKYFFLERNRHSLLLKYFGLRTLGLLMPALLATEILAWGYALRGGVPYVRAKIEATLYTLSHWSKNRARHRVFVGTRRISEGELLDRLSDEIPLRGIGGGIRLGRPVSRFVAVLNGLLSANRRRARLWLR